jgi:DNA-binding CsgD family transcriptional regulator
MPSHYDYTMIKDFIERYNPQGFTTISREDPWMLEMEKKLRHNSQFFYIADLLQMKILYTSSGSRDIIGIDPDQLNLSTFITRTHPEDQQRYSLARSMVIKTGYELLIKKKGVSLISSHFQQKNPSGDFFNLLFQAYSFYCEEPHKTVFTFLLLTDLSSFNIDKYGYHYYKGDDSSMFRYPDEELLKIGHVFSHREFEIIKLIAQGLGSEQIADKLFLSVNTVDTHRRNILKKTNKSTTHDLVIELQEKGIL